MDDAIHTIPHPHLPHTTLEWRCVLLGIFSGTRILPFVPTYEMSNYYFYARQFPITYRKSDSEVFIPESCGFDGLACLFHRLKLWQIWMVQWSLRNGAPSVTATRHNFSTLQNPRTPPRPSCSDSHSKEIQESPTSVLPHRLANKNLTTIFS
jgi:hypothetical protein